METHSGFSSRLGYILSAAGSAVGLGNIWRFPYCVASQGGGIFLAVYVVALFTFGYSLLIAENGLGRMTGMGPVGTYRQICKGKTGFLGFLKVGGWLNAIVPLIIVPYYCVIGGWVTKYVVALLVNPVSRFDAENAGASAEYFTNFISSTWEPMVYFVVFVAIVVGVIALGVKEGIERFNKVLMPLLVLIIVCLCIYCLRLPDAFEGVKYYLKPDFSKFSAMTLVTAVGQLFYSLSIAMGIMITYGSYMRKDDDLIANVNHVALFDTVVAFLAGLMIIPALVSFGGEAAAQNAGPGLVFIVLPQVFASFFCGKIVGVAFFLLMLFAAATSAISLLETNVQSIGQELKLSRRNSIIYGVIEILVIGCITVLGYSCLKFIHPLAFIKAYANMDILDSLDFVSNNVLLPICAIFTTILIVGVFGLEKFCKEVSGERPWYRRWLFQLCMCVVIIPCLLIILLNSMGIIGK